MRTLRRNQRLFYYASVTGKTKAVDAEGFRTGNDIPVYSTRRSARGYITGDMSVGRTEEYGIFSRYDNSVSKSGFSRLVILSGTAWDISENTVLWLDDLNGNKPFDYLVKRVTKTMTDTILGVAKVKLQ